MKKSLLSLAGIGLGLMFGLVVNAQEDWTAWALSMYDVFPDEQVVSDSYIQLLNNYDQRWGFMPSARFTGNMENSTLKIETPILFDYDVYEAPTYRLYFSTQRVDQLRRDNWIDLSSIYMSEGRWDGSSNYAELEIDANKYNLDAQAIYYWFITPINDYEIIWTPSREVCFQFDRWIFQWWDECDTLETIINPVVVEPDPVVEDVPPVEEDHGAAGNCVGMDLANISHTVNGDTITLRWTAVEGDVVQIAVWDENQELYKPIWAVKMSDEKFAYKMTWDGEHNFKITNGCKDVFYKADAAIKTKEPTIVPPATGPAENILYIAIAAIVLYGAYTLITRKSEN